MTAMPLYSSFKPSMAPWVGELPTHWEEKPLYAVARERRDPNTGMRESNLLSLSFGRIIRKDINTSEGLLPDSFETYQVVQPGDIVFRLTDLQNDQRSLRSAIVGESGIITSAYLAAVPEGISPMFFSYLMRAYDVQKVFYSMGGGLRQSLKYDDLRRMPVLIPSSDEQERIVSYLDRETTRIDKLIEKKNLFLDLNRERIAALVDEAISDSALEWVRFGHVASRVNRPADLSGSDSFVRLGLFNRGRGIFHKPAADKEEMGDSTFYFVEEGDLIISGQFAWEGAVAMATAEENGSVVSHRYPIYRGVNGVATEYLLAFLRSDLGAFVLADTSRGSAGRNRPLNASKLEKEKLPIPTGEFQKRIAAAIAFEREMKRLVDSSIELLREHRSALITAAVTGKIDVRNAA